VKTIKKITDNKIDVTKLTPGSYILRCISGNETWEGHFIKK
jgi:hypothetical protein